MLHNSTFYFYSPSFFFFPALSHFPVSESVYLRISLWTIYLFSVVFKVYFFLVIKATICNVFWLASYRMWRPANETQSFSRIIELVLLWVQLEQYTSVFKAVFAHEGRRGINSFGHLDRHLSLVQRHSGLKKLRRRRRAPAGRSGGTAAAEQVSVFTGETTCHHPL